MVHLPAAERTADGCGRWGVAEQRRVAVPAGCAGTGCRHALPPHCTVRAQAFCVALR